MDLNPKYQVFIVNNEASRAALAATLDAQCVLALSFDWSLLAGYRLVFWPTNIPAAIPATERNAREAFAAGAQEIKIVGAGDMQEGWDAAAAVASGMDRAKLLFWLKPRVKTWELHDEPEPVVDWQQEEPPPHDQPASLPGAPSQGWDPSASPEVKWEMLGLTVIKNNPVCNVDTVLRILGRHPQLGDVLWFDEFLQRIMRKDQKTKQPREWADADEVDLLALLQRDLALHRLKLSDVKSAIISVAFRTRKNCAQDWMNGLKWDGKPRIDEFFQDTFGCESTVYTRAVSKNFWISMVARIMDPGCKVDNMVILEGSQGAGKSSSMEVLGGDWFAVQHENVTTKGFMETLQGKMLIEISEMDAFGKAEVTKVKSVVTTRNDRFRDAYGHYSRDHARTSIFVGTTNKDDWNRDETGARRFWPIRCRQAADIPLLRSNREQLFAEAIARWRKGESWWEMPLLETSAEQDERREDDSWLDPTEEWLGVPYKSQTTVGEALWGAIKMPLADHNQQHMKRMGAVLHRLGWRKKHTAKGNVWFRQEK